MTSFIMPINNDVLIFTSKNEAFEFGFKGNELIF
jgi:hypothetical protein